MLEEVKLEKGWAGFEAGETITVDSARAAQLKKDGFLQKTKKQKVKLKKEETLKAFRALDDEATGS